MFKHYYQLTKPGIIYGNAVTAAAGFFLASRGHVDIKLLLVMLVGLSLVIASGCVINNYLDRNFDIKMERTKNRALATGEVSVRDAIIFAAILGIAGFLILYFYTNLLTFYIAVAGTFIYLAVYTPLKRRTTLGAVIGSLSGAVPPLVGYCSVTNKFDMGAGILLFILCIWQLPHFYAIAIYRLEDYATAAIPVLPVKKGIRVTKIHMLCYVIAFIVATSMLTVYGYTGFSYFAVMLLLGVIWLIFSIKGFFISDDKKWARKMFFLSLIILVLFSVMVSVDNRHHKSLAAAHIF